MTGKLVVSNSSPLIALAQIGQLHLLESVFTSITVPVAVVDEISPTIPTLPPWIKVSSLDRASSTTILRASLGAGESEAICLAIDLKAAYVLIDDRPARRVAQAVGLNVLGTLGLLLAAKRRGLLTAVRPHLDRLTEHGFWTSHQLYARVLAEAGEDSE